VFDLDATLTAVHSDKEQAAATFKGGFGYHPLLCWLDNTGEALAGRLRPGNAGANTATDHIAVLDDALAQVPDAHRHGTPILVRTDGAGCSKDFLAHVRGLRDQGVATEFSVGFTMTEPVKAAIDALPGWAWMPAIEADAELRDGAEVAELTGLLGEHGDLTAAGWPAGIRVIVHRERPHPGAQLSLLTKTTGCATSASPPTPPSDDTADSWHIWRPGIAPTPGSRIGSAAPRTPGWAASRPGTSRSTPPGSSSPWSRPI
jgi:Transposase DDE domain group 1